MIPPKSAKILKPAKFGKYMVFPKIANPGLA